MSEKCEINKCNNCSDALLNEMQKVMIKNHKLQSKCDKLEKKNKVMRDALEKYAEKLYFPRSLIRLAQEKGERLAPIYGDLGQTAQEALKQRDRVLCGY